jgi:D-alanyl-D-alanine carboxypeptidase/D-alanyl-D-alanine-endopeptidase (penicillin-binding protein 4)
MTSALSGHHRVVPLTTWSELEQLLVSEPVDGCVLDADHPNRGEALAHVRRIRANHPHLAIVAFADFEGKEIDLFLLGGIGIDGVLLASPPGTAPSIRETVDQALTFARAERVRRSVEGRYGPVGTRAVAWAVEHAMESPCVATLASAMGQSSRKLGVALRSAGLPPPRRVLLWGRLLLAGALLSRDGRTVEETAFSLGYSTANALARAMKHETGHTPADVAHRGGMSFVQGILFPRGGRRGRRRGMPRRVLRGAVLALCFASLHPTSAAAQTKAGVDGRAIDSVFDAAPLDRVHFGVLAVDAASGRILYARNADQTLIPASNEKLLVGATAMSLLGAGYRFQTTLWSAAPLSGDTLQGDLVLVGTGDPSLSDPTWENGEAALAALADSLRTAGVNHVAGSLVVDASTWDSTTVPETWEASDLPHGYAATAGAFAIDDGALTVIARGGVQDEPASLEWWPHGTPGFVSANVITGPPDSVTRVKASYLPESHRLMLDGRVQPGSVDTLSFALRDPVRESTAALARILAEHGIDVRGGWRVAWDPGTPLGSGCLAGTMPACPGARPMATLRSPELGDILAVMLGDSQNWIAEQLVRVMGAEYGARGSMSEGLDVVRSFATDRIGIDSLDLSLHDGSGLSMHDLVTPRAIVRILRYMGNGPDGARYRAALAKPGEKKSTLEHRLEDLQGRLFAKTGTLTGVNSLSGYLVTEGGREMIFSILSNGSSLPSETVRDAIDHVVHILSR